MEASAKSNPWFGRVLGDRGRYRLGTRLGGGGMGDVYLAIDTMLGYEVVVKLLKEKLLEESDLRRRFEREVRLCAAIKSDNVVQVKDFGVTDEGNPFYVMEYLQGQTLGQLLRQSPRLKPERAVAIARQICAGLKVAHQGVTLWHDGVVEAEGIQIVHRDLKPENIFLTSSTLGELVKILDFGIAKATGNTGDSTSTGVFMGTFQYAAPEQLEVRKDLDVRADIYSLGMILYEMLTGTDPFGCSEAPHSGAVCWVRSHISITPKPLRQQPGCDALAAELEVAVLKCLEKLPENRFQTIEELEATLRSAIGASLDETTIVMQNLSAPGMEVHPITVDATTSARSPELQKKLETLLSDRVGPIAPVLIRQALAKSHDMQEILQSLAQHIPEHQRTQFLAKGNALAIDPTMDVTNARTVAQRQASTKASVPPPPLSTASTVDAQFLQRCECELIELIGPMGRLIVQRHYKPHLSRQDLVEVLAQQLPDPKQVAKFRDRMR